MAATISKTIPSNTEEVLLDMSEGNEIEANQAVPQNISLLVSSALKETTENLRTEMSSWVVSTMKESFKHLMNEINEVIKPIRESRNVPENPFETGC